MKRVDENPPARFPHRPILAAEFPWWVAKVKPRQEKAIASDFIRQNVEYYLPLFTKVTRRKDNNKPRKSVLPLFPGYVSFSSKDPYADGIYKTGRVVSVIEIRNQRHFVEELSQIHQALDCGIMLEPVGHAYPPGTMVCVVAGPLRGIKGVIARVQDSDRLVLSVTGLGHASMVVDSSLVKPYEQ
jgi:transcription antitermination factor NusG